MGVLKYNDRQLSIFNFERSYTSRQTFLDNLKDTLGLEQEKEPKRLLEACCKKPSIFSIDQRHFLYDMAVLFFDGKQMSEKQIRYLSNLSRKCLTSN